MPRKKQPHKPIKGPGRWGKDACVKFYNKCCGDFQRMLEATKAFKTVPRDPAAFVAQIVDVARGTKSWREPERQQEMGF